MTHRWGTPLEQIWSRGMLQWSSEKLAWARLDKYHHPDVFFAKENQESLWSNVQHNVRPYCAIPKEKLHQQKRIKPIGIGNPEKREIWLKFDRVSQMFSSILTILRHEEWAFGLLLQTFLQNIQQTGPPSGKKIQRKMMGERNKSQCAGEVWLFTQTCSKICEIRFAVMLQ